MTAPGPKNLPASIRSRLKNASVDTGIDFNQTLQYYAMERFLYRLSKTHWANDLVVKGAVMLRVWDGAIARPTRDIDFLGRMDNTPEAISGVVRDCLQVDSLDGLEFSPDFEVTQIIVGDRYPGLRVVLIARLAGAKMRLQLDIGLCDDVVPAPGWVNYPSLLGMEQPRILAYRPETAIAEKVHAMLDHGLINSRIKDYYDIWMLSQTIEMQGTDLQGALSAVLNKRGKAAPLTRPAVLGATYSRRPEAAAQWKAFSRRLGSAGISPPESFETIVDGVSDLITPLLLSIAHNEPFDHVWTPGGGWQ